MSKPLAQQIRKEVVELLDGYFKQLESRLKPKSQSPTGQSSAEAATKSEVKKERSEVSREPTGDPELHSFLTSLPQSERWRDT
ncbi:MAG: hypothetical protein R3E01_36385 [Pirellulaceae bacterium]|nr:hypothetical protein [Planctomycetales bacterium]